MIRIKEEKPRGILNPQTGKTKFHEMRYLPSDAAAFFVEHYWVVEWNLTGQEPYVSETLPHPCVHIVFEKETSYVIGVVKGKFSRPLTGAGIVVGIKFWPGAFYPFIRRPVSQYTGRVIPLHSVFGETTKELHNTILAIPSPVAMAEHAEAFLLQRLPERDENVSLLRLIVDTIIADRSIAKVEDVVEKCGISKRTLQRIFQRYVGINPKWMIKRYRLHEAIEQLDRNSPIDFAALALQLGYFDQAHFINDFKTLVGKSPARYLSSLKET